MWLEGDLADRRKRWISAISTQVVARLESCPALHPAAVAPGLGDVPLVRALLVMRIATLIGSGRPDGSVVDQLGDSPIFTTPRPQRPQLAELVSTVRRLLERDGLTGWIALIGLGLHTWSPENSYLFLLQTWSSERLKSFPSRRVKKELRQCWGVQDRNRLQACLSHVSDPLADHRDAHALLDDQSDSRVANLIAYALNHPAGDQALDRWADRLQCNGAEVYHLFTIGTDLIRARHAPTRLQPARDGADRELAKIAASALEAIRDFAARMDKVVAGLTILEAELLREHTDNEHLQDTCLSALMNWSFQWVNRPSLALFGTAHGMRGPWPWWAMMVRTDDQTRAAEAALAEGTLPLGFVLDRARPDRLALVCRKPRTHWAAPGLRAHFCFDLDNPVHASELLAISRRGEVCVDVFREHSESGDQVDLGTIRVVVPREVAHFLLDTASAALKKSVPADFDPDHDGLGSLSPDTPQWLAGGYRLDVGLVERELIVAGPVEQGEEIALEIAYPPVSMTAPRTDPGQPSAIMQSAQRSRAHRHGGGFVYVKQNPAFPDLLKIGYTDRLAEDRAAELYSTEVPFPFDVLHRSGTSHAHEVEQAVHRMLAAHRVNPEREFFQVDQHTAEEAIRHCRRLTTGIDIWEPMPALHRLRNGDRLTLSLEAGQIFVITAYRDPLTSSAAEIIDIWQAHNNGDILELHITDDPGRTSGFSDNDPGSCEDPVPFLDRDATAPNGILIGRERLVAGDRLSWLADHAGTCTNVVFEVHDFCQVTCRTWHPRHDADGVPLLLPIPNRSEPASPAMVAAVREALALGPPRSLAPRHPDPEHWVPPATQSTEPDYWLPQLRPRQRRRR